MSSVRLPGAAAFVPPPAPPLPPSPPPPPPGVSGGPCEYFFQQVDTPRGQQELSLYVTKKPWRGIDVYLAATNAVPLSSVFTIRIYAIVDGMRAMVSTGRYNFVASTAGANVQIPPTLVAAARSGGVKFEVTVSWNAQVGVNNTQPVQWAIYASDQLTVDPPPLTGAPIPFAGNNTTQWDTAGIGGVVLYPDAEIRQIVAVNTAAAARYVLLIETDAGTVVGAGFVATMSFPIGAIAGQGALFDNVRYRVRPGRRMRIFASSTGPTLTAVGDAFFTLRVA